ncbi:MAG: TIGR04211 family SH3 domain-containing protein [Bdellovibrio bacteriovorus]
MPLPHRLFASAVLSFALGATSILPAAIRAETRYVTDRLEVTLRAGESTRYKILRMLPSGTPVEVLGVNKSTNYARVRIQDGTVGFVLAQELMEEPAARSRLAEVEERLAALRQKPDALTAELASLQESHAELRERFATLEREKQQREQELATIRHASANVLDITSDRERLRVQVAELTRARADLEQQYRDLKNQTTQRWFLIGAGVLGGGVLMGLLLPHLRLGRRKNPWGGL